MPRPARIPALMLQGTGSDVGKSLLLAGLARVLTRRGYRVRPFKPQNMSNNAAVTADGGEIGRAQALQARACGIAPSVDMNPVLLKPQSATGAQVIVQGKLLRSADARAYHDLKPALLPAVLESFDRLAREADLILVEGAGSPAEINLRQGDIANMGFAEAADLPVVLIGDIDRGGVIASLVGTQALLPPAEAARLKGYIINKFRGDPTLFADAVAVLCERTGMPSLGIVPFFPAARNLPAEDSLSLSSSLPGSIRQSPAGESALPEGDARVEPGHDGWGRQGVGGQIKIAVPRLPHIANFDDLDPLAAEPGIVIDLVGAGHPLPADAALVLLPGSKSTIADLAAFRAAGWEIDLAAHLRRGGRVLGLCGGYQMLGRRIADPEGSEGPAGEVPGLGHLAVETILGGSKTLRAATGTELRTGEIVRGYEIHLGRTTGPDTARPMLRLGHGSGEWLDGARSADGRVSGCYLHGLFASDGFRRRFLAALGAAPDATLDYEARIEAILDELADHLEAHLDIARLVEIAHAR